MSDEHCNRRIRACHVLFRIIESNRAMTNVNDHEHFTSIPSAIKKKKRKISCLKFVLETFLDFETFRGFNSSSDPSPICSVFNRRLLPFLLLVSTTKNENRAYYTYTLSALNCRKFFDVVPFTKQFYKDFTPGPSTIGRSSRDLIDNPTDME